MEQNKIFIIAAAVIILIIAVYILNNPLGAAVAAGKKYCSCTCDTGTFTQTQGGTVDDSKSCSSLNGGACKVKVGNTYKDGTLKDCKDASNNRVDIVVNRSNDAVRTQ